MQSFSHFGECVPRDSLSPASSCQESIIFKEETFLWQSLTSVSGRSSTKKPFFAETASFRGPGFGAGWEMSVEHFGRGFFSWLKPVMGQNFRNAKVGSLCSLQGFQSLPSRINGFGVKRRGLGALGFSSLPGEKGVTRQKNGKC